MKLRYRRDAIAVGGGFLILECEPMMRSIIVHSQSKLAMRVPFPYMYFFVRYLNLNYDTYDSYMYPGVFGSGLRTFLSPMPLKGFTDEVFFVPTEQMYSGLCCTEHAWDGCEFKSVSQLANFAITLWWGHIQSVCKDPFLPNRWQDMGLKDLGKAKWQSAGNLLYALENSRAEVQFGSRCTHSGDMGLRSNDVLIEESWQPTLQLPNLVVE